LTCCCGCCIIHAGCRKRVIKAVDWFLNLTIVKVIGILFSAAVGIVVLVYSTDLQHQVDGIHDNLSEVNGVVVELTQSTVNLGIAVGKFQSDLFVGAEQVAVLQAKFAQLNLTQADANAQALNATLTQLGVATLALQAIMANLQAGVGNFSALLGALAHIDPRHPIVLQNGWQYYPDGHGGVAFPPYYYQDRGRVYLGGLIGTGQGSQIAFTLPRGYTPFQVANWIVLAGVKNIDNVACRMGVNLDGTVQIQGGQPCTSNAFTYVWLDGLSFTL